MGAVECRLPMATVVCRGEGKSTKSSKRKLASVVSHSTSEALTQINLASLHIVVCMRYNGCSGCRMCLCKLYRDSIRSDAELTSRQH